MVDYDPPAPQVLPFQNLPSTDTPLTAEWLNHVDAFLADLGNATTGRVAVLETTASAEGIRDTIAAALTAGTGITVTPNDGSDTITVATTITQYTDENARDALGTALVEGDGIEITVSDGSDTITIAATGGSSYTAENARDDVGAALAGTTTAGQQNPTVTVNDGADTITIGLDIGCDWQPADHGYKAWAFDPNYAVGSTAMGTTGVLHLVKIKVPVAATITGVALRASSAGSSVSGGYVALYDSAGTRVAVSSAITSAWNSGGLKQNAFTSTYAAAAGVYYVGILVSGGTAPSWNRTSTSQASNDGLTVATQRFSTYSSGLSSTPSSLTLANQLDPVANWWCALY